MIQPLPQECGVRRAFPAITGRGRGWRANGFNYHSDRNTGRQGPARHSPDGLVPGPLVPSTATLSPAWAWGGRWPGSRRSTAGPQRATRGHMGSGSRVGGAEGKGRDKGARGLEQWGVFPEAEPRMPDTGPTAEPHGTGGTGPELQAWAPLWEHTAPS